jgi:AraC-like DNA-binding protein
LKCYNLPQDLLENEQLNNNEVLIKSYRAACNTVNNRIILHQNMINLLVRGSKTIVYAEETATITSDSFLILSTGNCLTSELVPHEGTFASVLIYFSNDVLTDFLAKHQSGLHKQTAQQQRKPFLCYGQDAFIRNYITSLTLMLDAGSEIPSEFKLHKLEELLLYLLYQDPTKLHSLLVLARDNDDLSLRRAVETNVGRNITVDQLAFLCNISPSTFKRRFQRIYHTSPQKWFIEQKMKLAAELLKHPQERPGQVFLKIGYENHSSFSETFKQLYGLSPKDYQAQFMVL